jgi:hypothetical protein
MSDFEKELDKLFKTATTPEQRKEFLAAFLELIYEVSDDEEWAILRKQFDEAVAKRGAH